MGQECYNILGVGIYLKGYQAFGEKRGEKRRQSKKASRLSLDLLRLF